jgi:hypothetical protein
VELVSSSSNLSSMRLNENIFISTLCFDEILET